eukprot:3005653-Lingulodinium_polyedra.AAC.1
MQLVFGSNLRVPHELLADDPNELVGLEDLREGADTLDSASAAFQKAAQVRALARSLLMQADARDKLSRARRAAPHRDRTFVPGQW